MVIQADFYAPLNERLSQADIIDGVPWGLVDDPVVLCRPDDRSKPEGKARYGPLDPKSPAKGIENIHARAQVGKVMVLWHDCQIDKFANQGKAPKQWFAAVAPIQSLPTNSQAVAENIRAGLRRAFFPIPAYPAIGVAEDGYVDLRHIWSVKQSLLAQRLGTLSAPARANLYAHLFSFLTQRRAATALTCPHCQATVPFEGLFPSTAEED